MATTKLSNKGQVIIPKGVREAHGWEPGMDFEIEEQGDCIILRPVRTLTATTLDDVVGCLKWDGAPVSLADMDEAVMREAKKRASQ